MFRHQNEVPTYPGVPRYAGRVRAAEQQSPELPRQGSSPWSLRLIDTESEMALSSCKPQFHDMPNGTVMSFSAEDRTICWQCGDTRVAGVYRTGVLADHFSKTTGTYREVLRVQPILHCAECGTEFLTIWLVCDELSAEAMGLVAVETVVHASV